MADGPVAADGMQIPVWSGGQQRLVSWHPPPEPPDGTPHGAEGSVWRADVELRSWQARFEIADRRVVAPATIEDALSLGSQPFAPFIRRVLREAAV